MDLGSFMGGMGSGLRQGSQQMQQMSRLKRMMTPQQPPLNMPSSERAEYEVAPGQLVDPSQQPMSPWQAWESMGHGGIGRDEGGGFGGLKDLMIRLLRR